MNMWNVFSCSSVAMQRTTLGDRSDMLRMRAISRWSMRLSLTDSTSTCLTAISSPFSTLMAIDSAERPRLSEVPDASGMAGHAWRFVQHLPERSYSGA